MFLGTLCNSIKQIYAPYVFDGEHGIALHAMLGNQAHLAARGKSDVFYLVAVGNWGTFLSYSGDGHSNLLSVQQCHNSCLVTRDTSGISMRLGRAIRMILEVKREREGHILVATVIMRFLSIFKKSQALSSFEALNSACLSRYQIVVSPPV